jgi:hypothetical protein
MFEIMSGSTNFDYQKRTLDADLDDHEERLV